MALARLQERIELLENQIKENEILELHNAQQKLNNDKYLNLHSVGSNLYKIINLLELASSEATPQSVEQLAIAIMPLVEQVAPYIDKFENLKQFAEVGKINELTRNKEKIIKLGEFQKLQYERAEKLGENTSILLAHYNALIDTLARDFALLEGQIAELEESKNEN